MKVCIFGAGAVGGHVAARLAHAGHAAVSVVARGAHLMAIREAGLLLRNDQGEQWQARPAAATDEPARLPPQDIVLVALKAASLPAQAGAIARLLAPGGLAVFLNNGIPWWWNHGAAADAPSQGALPLLDPQGALWREVDGARAAGAVVHSPNEVESPGVIVHRSKHHNRFVFGLASPASSTLNGPALQRLVGLFQASGLPAQASDDVRREIWHKLLVNAAGNPLSALTRLDTAARAQAPGLLQLGTAVAQEIASIAAAMGWPIAADRVIEAASVGKAQSMRPSMLQDVLLQRPMEVEALLGQPQAFARLQGVATPHIDVLVPLLRGLGRSMAQPG